MSKEAEQHNVLVVHNYYQIPGGEDTVVINEKQMLERHGHRVILYSRNNSELKIMGKVQRLMLPINTVFSLRTYRDIKKLIEEEKITIIHVHNTLSLISPSVYYAAKVCKIPVVQTIHNFRLLCPGATFYRDGHICEDCVQHGIACAIKHSCYRGSKLQTLACVISTVIHRCTRIYSHINYICLTEFNKSKLLQLKQINKERVFVKPNFVDSVVDFVPESKRENQYIYAGRLDKLKGIDILFEAWKMMGLEAPLLIVCGTGPMEDWCREYIEMNNINAKMKGFVSNSNVQKIIANSKALILPTQWYEGFPMSIVEAYSVGTPVICSDLGNAGSVVEEGVTGCKFMPKSAGDLVSAIRRCNNLSESTVKKYKALYTEEKNYEMCVDIYSSLKS